MTKSAVGMLEEFAGQAEARAGAEACGEVLAGREAITAKTDAIAVARWMAGALDRLDQVAPAETAIAIMEGCGASCAAVNHVAIERAVARRQKHRSEEAFLAAELKKPMAGTRLERQGDTLHQFYTPRAFRGGMRCYCGLVRALPEDETMSRTYCHCSKAFVRTLWEAVLGRPVAVELVSSALSGARECEFEIRIA